MEVSILNLPYHSHPIGPLEKIIPIAYAMLVDVIRHDSKNTKGLMEVKCKSSCQ